MNALHNVGRALRRTAEYALMAVGVPVAPELPADAMLRCTAPGEEGTPSLWKEGLAGFGEYSDPNINPATGHMMATATLDVFGYDRGGVLHTVGCGD